MCGRFAFYAPREAIRELFGVEFPEELTPRYNIAPTQPVPAIRRAASGVPEAAMLRWGLIPAWASDPAVGNRMINARAETLAAKPAFRKAYRHRRCLILASGFYEWRKRGRIKTPFYVTMPDERPIAFAGLWEQWEKGQRLIESCSIITTDANRELRDLHDRMPVILAPAAARRWLSPEEDPVALTNLLRPAPDGSLAVREVSRAVNSPAHDGPQLIAPQSPARA